MAVQFLLLRAAVISSGGEMHYPDQDAHATVVNDGLVWITPKPESTRQVGWEDGWMMDWKRRHYSPSQRPHCNTTVDTPYDEDTLCEIPGYIPARLYLPREEQPHIPRVIFISWLDRRLGRAMYTSLLTLLHHNPDYELIFFDDEDVDGFICENVGSSEESFAIPVFSKVQAGAMRADIWRMLIIQQYGGVYLDSDVSALGKLPIEWDDMAVSGVGRWSHLPGEAGGVLEHWALAFMPNHPFINKVMDVMRDNLEHPGYLMRDDTPEAAAEDSVTMRLTGPAMYQYVLHNNILMKAKCKKRGNSYCPALWAPERHCGDMEIFRSFFPGSTRFFRSVNLDNAVTHKMFYPASSWEKETTAFQDDYDSPRLSMLKEAVRGYCGAEAFAIRAARRESIWLKNVEKNE
ncbi:hypothetical protein ACHAXR_002906 [Thalassiosira sp. AJA248-18]